MDFFIQEIPSVGFRSIIELNGEEYKSPLFT